MERQFRSGFSPLFGSSHFIVAMRFLTLVNLRSDSLSATETEKSELGGREGVKAVLTGGSE